MTTKSRVRFLRLDIIEDETVAVFDGLGIGEFSLNRKRLAKHVANRRQQGFDVTIEAGVLATLNKAATQ